MPNLTLKLNDKRNLQELLQQIYDESGRMLTEIQIAINSLETSTKLADETIDGKAKYAKAMHDFHGDKDRAIRLKMDVAKIMNEVLKFQGDQNKVLANQSMDLGVVDINQLRRQAKVNNSTSSVQDEEEEVKVYTFIGQNA